MNLRKSVFLIAFLATAVLTGHAQPREAFAATVKAPDIFRAVFTTTKGDFTIEVYRKWSPLGADRLYQLLKSRFFDQNCIFRVQKDYVVQFGIGDNREVNKFWENHPLKDEPVLTLNEKGTISFARDGAESRTAQLFINMKDNLKLDTVNYNGLRGFPPVGRVISGFETVEQFYGGYGFEPANFQDSAMVQGNAFWMRKFAGLDYILKAVLEE